MTAPNDDIDFESVLEEAGKSSVSSRQKARSKKYAWIATIAGIIIVAFAGYLIFAFATKTSFEEDIPLTENISRWTPLGWESDGINDEGQGVSFSANGVEWTPSDKGKYFEGSIGEDTCSLTFTRIGNGLGVSDLKSTEMYTEEFQRENKFSGLSETWLETTVGVNVEFMRASYSNASGDNLLAYYRGSPENSGFVMLILSCGAEESLEKILPDNGGSEVSEIALLRPSSFSPF